MPSLLSTIDKADSAIYYSARFRQMIEDHLSVIREMTTNTVETYTQDDWAKLDRFTGDFYSFLFAVGKQARYHWVILRLNGYRSNFAITPELQQLVMPDWEYIDKLAQLAKEKR